MTGQEMWERRYQRERRARELAESLLEEKSAALYKSNRELAARLADIEKLAEKERRLRERIETQQAQLLQNEKMASIGQLAAGVAHEINNPIGFVSSNLNSLAEYVGDIKQVLDAYEGLLTDCRKVGDLASQVDTVERSRKEADLEYLLEDVGELINDSIDGAQRVRKIVADLKDFSHVDGPELAEEDVDELLDKTINVAWNELKYRAEIHKEYGAPQPLMCNGGQLSQVFLNLLVNAAQAIPEFGSIEVRTGQSGEQVWAEIEDDGCGISQQNLVRIFDPFFTTKAVGQGTGLGLHLARNIIKTHGGRIVARSEEGKGSVFRVELPLGGPSQQAVAQ